MYQRSVFSAVLVSIGFLACVALIGGCGPEVAQSYGTRSGAAKSDYGVEAESAVFDVDSDGIALTRAASRFRPEEVAELIPVAAEAQPAVAGRKIIYNARVRMVVDDLADFVVAIRTAVADQGGFIGTSSESGIDGSNPSATLTIRVPSTGYSTLLRSFDDLGTLIERSETSRDVTAEFVDVEARIRNKEREEARLLELLEDATGKLVDVLQVEKELSRVRGEIERAKGQMNVLRDQIDLATITVTASERTVYSPAKPAVFGDRIAAAWSNSLTNLGEFGTRASIQVVAFIPWLTIWLPLGLVAWGVVRRIRRTRQHDLATEGS